ncbi:hypothetical protein ABS764_09100 [Flavobacterium sp. ST-87]|uniref:Vitellogenin II n=1 Tax=Flavobacterium plantiphilum TaxID=3163297 RepID=A0ABW8XTJ0_9FLAO
MKTNIFPFRKAKNYLYIGLLSLFMISCGSYQNSSYYESDGIYSTSTDPRIERRNTNSDNYYKDYFNSLQSDSESEIITDIDKYSDFDSVNNDSYTGYAGWGDNQTGTIVNIYPDYWGMNYGFGWNNWGWNNWGWNNWGMNYGFGWNNWGWNNWGINYGFGWNNWGYNNWGWNNNYYYYNRPNYSTYTPTRRRSVSNSANYSSGNRTYTPTRSYSTDRVNSRRPTFTNPRTYNRNNPTNSNNQTTTRRSATQNTTTTRQQSNYSRNESYTPSRSYSSPSSNSGRSYGGSSSGGGGSRSSGGGRR